MPSRRYYIAIAPIEHINGKMAPVADVVHNEVNPPVDPTGGFWYGYRPRWAKRSYYGIRTKPRNLTTNPYTPDELNHRTLFTTSLQAVNAAWGDVTKRNKCLEEFSTQSQYSTPKGFATGITYFNGGTWPVRWT